MKKGLLLIAFTAALIMGAVYTVSSYNKTNSKKIIENQSNSQVQTSIPESKETDAAKKPVLQLNDSGLIKKAKDFKLKDLNGKEVSLSDFNATS